MQHRGTRRHRKLGWPELWLICSVALTVAPATIWWMQHYKPEWKQTAGHITSSEFSRRQYNAQDPGVKTNVSYEYWVGMAKHAGQFDGLWPEFGGPNALAQAEIEKLREPKREVVVFYDPTRSDRSTLHPGTSKASPLWIVLAAAGLFVGGAYMILVYPAWRA